MTPQVTTYIAVYMFFVAIPHVNPGVSTMLTIITSSGTTIIADNISSC